MRSFNSFIENNRGRLLIAAAVGVVVLLVIIGVLRRGSTVTPTADLSGSSLTVTVQTLQTQPLARSITANGTIHPWQEIVIGPEVGGYRVAAVHVDVGDRVRRGQEVVRLADEMLSAEVASRRASLQQAQATLENAAADYRRAQSLSKSGVLSASDLDRLRSEELAARARVAVSEAELETAELRLKHTRVTAPDDGVISARSVNVGQIAQAGNEMLRLLRQSRTEWRAEIPEARVKDIRVGQVVQITTADGTQVEGRVRAVPPTIQSSTRAGLVYVDLPLHDAIRPGMFARGDIVLETSDAQMAPLASVVIQDGYSYVFVVDASMTVQRRRVTTGIVRDNAIEIIDGVVPGERIVDKGAGFLKDGDRVHVVASAPETVS